MKKRLTIQDKAMLAMRKAIRGVVARHKKSGRPMSIWEDGRVKRVIVK